MSGKRSPPVSTAATLLGHRFFLYFVRWRGSFPRRLCWHQRLWLLAACAIIWTRTVDVWQEGFAQEEDAGVPITLTVPDLAGHRVTGFDVLYSFQQPMVTEARGGALLLRDLLARDYPLLLRISPVRRVFVPLSLGGSPG